MKVKIKPEYLPIGIVFETKEETRKFLEIVKFITENWLSDRLNTETLNFAFKIEEMVDEVYKRLIGGEVKDGEKP